MIRQLETSAVLLLFVSILALSSCTTAREREMEDDLSQFRTWVNQQTSQLANRTEEDWERAKQDFRMRTQQLDQQQDEFTDELRAEYEQLKQEFREADETYAQVRSEALKSEWERNLLGPWAGNMSAINETNVRDAYITFMENVRAQHESWTDVDWEMAEMVLEELNDRKSEISGNIDTDTEVKIKALQMEFRTLETAADISGD